MKATKGRRGQCLLAICGVALLLIGTGCSFLIASAGRASLADFAPGSTRQEVRAGWGEPDVSETRDDGTRIETYHIRMTVNPLWEKAPTTGNWLGNSGPGGLLLLGAYVGGFYSIGVDPASPS
jgi:hypothetical protein